MEMLVVILIMGAVAAFALPKFTETKERAMAEDAMTTLKLVATANRMYQADHGEYAGSWKITNACNVGVCAPNIVTVGNVEGACQLVRCKYLAPQDWDSKSYIFHVGTPNSPTDCTPWLPSGGGTYIACASRRGAAEQLVINDTPGNVPLPYAAWFYSATGQGILTAYNGAPQPSN